MILYIDDILIYSTAFNDHLSHVAQAIQTLKVTYLKIRINKSQFTKNSVEFVGHLINPDGIGSNKKNIEAVPSFPSPIKNKTSSCLPWFMQLLSTLHQELFSSAAPLLQLLKKNAAFHWHSPQHKSFMALMERLTTTPILVYPDLSIPFTLYTDASGDSISFKHTQIQHGQEHAIVYGG